MRKKLRVVLALTVLAGMAILGVRPAPAVEVRTADGRVLAQWPLVEGQVLALTFTHSMYGGDVREVYRVDAQRGLTLVEVTAQQAALDYYALPVSTGMGEYRTASVERPLGAIWVRADRIGRHRLAYGGQQLSLFEAAGDGVAVCVGVAQFSGIELLWLTLAVRMQLMSAGEALQVVDVQSGRLLAQVRVKPGDEFALSYINPAYGSRVIERFVVRDNGRVRLVKALYEQEAAGVDCSVQCDRLVKEGDYWVLESGRELEALRVLFSRENHAMMSYAGGVMVLDELMSPESTVRILLAR